jgi:hypothetical protein
MAKEEASFSGFAYQYFGWIGRPLSRFFYMGGRLRVAEDLESAGLKVYPEAYFSLLGFFLILFIIVSIPIALVTGVLPLMLLPLVVLLLGYAVPKVLAQDRASKT